MYGTVAKMEVQPGKREELKAVTDAQMATPVAGYIKSYALFENDSDTLWLTVLFEDKDSYMANADDTTITNVVIPDDLTTTGAAPSGGSSSSIGVNRRWLSRSTACLPMRTGGCSGMCCERNGASGASSCRITTRFGNSVTGPIHTGTLWPPTKRKPASWPSKRA